MAHDIQPKHHYSIITMQIALHCIDCDEAADGLNELIGQEIGEGFVADYSFNAANPTIVQATDEPEEGEPFVNCMPLTHIDNALKDLINASDESGLIDIIIARPGLANHPAVLDLIKLRKEALSNFNLDNDNIQFPRFDFRNFSQY